MAKFFVRVTENDGHDFRDVPFDDYFKAIRFKEAAEEDGTYYGWYEKEEE